MTSGRLQAALERFARAPADAAERLKMPASVERVSRIPLSWLPPPPPDRLAEVSIALANWLGRRGAVPAPDIFDDSPLIIADARTTFLYDPKFRSALTTHLANERRPRALLRMIDAYFQAELKVAPLLGPLILPHVARHEETGGYDAPAQLGLFAPETLPVRITEQVYEAEGDLAEALGNFGPEITLGTCPLASRALSQVPLLLVRKFAAGPSKNLDILLTALEQLKRRGAYDPPKAGAEFAKMLLAPANAGKPNISTIAVRGAVVGLLGDPLKELEAWKDVDLDLQRLAVSPHDTIELALTLTRGLDDLGPWKAKFWLGLADQGVIEEATLVAVGPLMDRLRQDSSFSSIARFVASAGSSVYATAILLMRAGGVTIGEWAPSGSCRLWFSGNPDAPAMRRNSYDIWKTRAAADYEQAHRGSQKGTWQRELIAAMSRGGVSIPAPERLI